jgi:hypothetical protein
MSTNSRWPARSLLLCAAALVAASAGTAGAKPTPSREVEERAQIAATSLEDAIVVDCQLPGRLVALGGMKNYMTPGRLTRLAAVDCRARGGEYSLGNLSSGTFSLKRWLPLAEKGDAEAQYYVARIYANGMDDVPLNYPAAVTWYRKAADQNYAAALQELGYLYEQGLGVEKDSLLALNMQRKAAGLGEELDYSSRIDAVKEDAARQLAALAQQLESANGEIADLRADLRSSKNALLQQRAELAKREDAVLDLRAQLASAQQPAAAPVAAAKVAALESALAAREAELRDAQGRASTLQADLAAREAALARQLSQSQGASLQLNELLASKQNENDALRARLAQAQQRLQTSQSELSNMQFQYRADVDRLTRERAALDAALASNGNRDQALVVAKQRELERQQLIVKNLEATLAGMKRASVPAPAPVATAATAAATSAAAAANARAAELQKQYDAQSAQLRAQRDELARLRQQSDAQLATARQQFVQQLNVRTSELETRRQRIATLESETEQLRTEMTGLRERRVQGSEALAKENAQLRKVVDMAQEKQSQLRDRAEQLNEMVEKLQADSAAQRADLMAARDQMQQLAQRQKAGEASHQAELAAMKSEIAAKEALVAAKEQRIAALQQELKNQDPVRLASTAGPGAAGAGSMGAIVMRSMSASNVVGGDADLLKLLRSSKDMPPRKYHALVIGNSTYCCMGKLSTPQNDAREVADLLASRYGYETQVLLDATQKEIMIALHEYTRTLTAADDLLIYYAGHGGTENGPPERAFWLGIDADPDKQETWISAENVRAKIKQMKAQHVLLVADSCFSGAIAAKDTPSINRKLNERRLQMQWNLKARMVLTSGQDTPVVDNAGSRSHSLFAKYFLQILRHNDTVLSGEALSYELNARIRSEAATLGVKQAPTYSSLRDADHAFGEFFFVPRPAQSAVAAL